MREGRYGAARYNLKPLAYYPHPSEGTERAKAMLAEIEGKPDKPTSPR